MPKTTMNNMNQELLDVLKALVAIIDLHYPRDHFTVLTHAREVIKKAEGA